MRNYHEIRCLSAQRCLFGGVVWAQLLPMLRVLPSFLSPIAVDVAVNARASVALPRGGRTCASTPSCARRVGGPGHPRPTPAAPRRLGTPAATRPSPPLLPRQPSDREPKVSDLRINPPPPLSVLLVAHALVRASPQNLRWPARSVVVRPSQTARTRPRQRSPPRLRCRRFCLRRSRCPACTPPAASTLSTPLLSGSQACPMAAVA